MTVKAVALPAPSALVERLRIAAIPVGLGATLIFLVGFAHTPALHNAAHDSRHGLSFPCH